MISKFIRSAAIVAIPVLTVFVFAPLLIYLGNPTEFSIRDLAERIRGLCDSGSEVVYRDLPPDDPKVRRPDISRARQVLDWEPQVEPNAGLLRTLPYFQGEVRDAKRGPDSV